MKKIPGDVIILHMCTINENHYAAQFLGFEAWQARFFLILDHFLPFYPLATQNNKILKKWKKKKNPGDIIILLKCNINDMTYDSWDVQFLSFWAIFSHFTPLATLKIDILKKFQKSHHHLIQAYQKSWSYAIVFLRYGVWQM